MNTDEHSDSELNNRKVPLRAPTPDLSLEDMSEFLVQRPATIPTPIDSVRSFNRGLSRLSQAIQNSPQATPHGT